MGSRRHLRSPPGHSSDADKPVASTEDISSPPSHFLALGHGSNFLMEHLPQGGSQLSSQLHLCHKSNHFVLFSLLLKPKRKNVWISAQHSASPSFLLSGPQAALPCFSKGNAVWERRRPVGNSSSTYLALRSCFSTRTDSVPGWASG